VTDNVVLDLLYPSAFEMTTLNMLQIGAKYGADNTDYLCGKLEDSTVASAVPEIRRKTLGVVRFSQEGSYLLWPIPMY